MGVKPQLWTLLSRLKACQLASDFIESPIGLSCGLRFLDGFMSCLPVSKSLLIASYLSISSEWSCTWPSQHNSCTYIGKMCLSDALPVYMTAWIIVQEIFNIFTSWCIWNILCFHCYWCWAQAWAVLWTMGYKCLCQKQRLRHFESTF